ncbi:MAG TPA: YciI family protein [Chthoniobacterales bacterium]|nr:YciI family protein [Chthoniobacterales bacterium]
MKHSYLSFFVSTACLLVAAHLLSAEEPKGEKPTQFIYVLRLVPRLYADSAWTKEDNMVLGRHFARFEHAIETGELILAGRTKEPGDKTFGIAIFEAKDEAAARAFMESDPAVVAGLMTAELHPFAVALGCSRDR